MKIGGAIFLVVSASFALWDTIKNDEYPDLLTVLGGAAGLVMLFMQEGCHE
jgi:hypothetical protein